ncbi:MAG: non-hydrolyzing UDP-N-acetylglucosamine 2-epimerase [Cyclobacteriaceae bacterium]
MKVTLIAGARPNFMKIAPIVHALEQAKNDGQDLTYRLIHTGQHYDKKLSESFFKDLNIPEPHVNLGVGSGSHATQTANILIKFEEELIENPADYVLVVGDVNSTMACAIVAKKLHSKVIHVEAGLRSYDLTMPEEINRMATDAITDIFYTTTPEAGYNLVRQGVETENIALVGNTMIDSLVGNLDRLRQPEIYKELRLDQNPFYVMTLHRPANVDEEQKLKYLLELISESSAGKPIIFPVHPRTKQILESLNFNGANIHMTPPLRYLEFMYLVKNSFAVITDSGGIQEETTYLKIPCMTLRENTERPETVTLGTNVICGLDSQLIKDYFGQLNSGTWKSGTIPALWDGKASQRIVKHLLELV